MNEVTCLINNSSKARGNTPRPREPRGQAGERRGRWVLGVGAGGWSSSAVLGESLHRTQDGAQPQQGSGWGSHSVPGCSVGAGPRCRSQHCGVGQPGLGPERGRTPISGKKPRGPFAAPHGPEVTPQHPAAAASCPGEAAKRLLCPGSSGQVLEVRAGRAAGPGITAGKSGAV